MKYAFAAAAFATVALAAPGGWGPPAAYSDGGSWGTSTVEVTKEVTITSCAATVTDCPAGAPSGYPVYSGSAPASVPAVYSSVPVAYSGSSAAAVSVRLLLGKEGRLGQRSRLIFTSILSVANLSTFSKVSLSTWTLTTHAVRACWLPQRRMGLCSPSRSLRPGRAPSVPLEPGCSSCAVPERWCVGHCLRSRRRNRHWVSSDFDLLQRPRTLTVPLVLPTPPAPAGPRSPRLALARPSRPVASSPPLVRSSLSSCKRFLALVMHDNNKAISWL